MAKKKSSKQSPAEKEERTFEKKSLVDDDKASTTKKKKKKHTPKKAHQVDEPEERDDDMVKDEKDIEEELEAIYGNDDGSMPDMSVFETRKKGALVRAFAFLLFSVAFLGAVAWLGFFFFQPGARFSESDVILGVTGDTEVDSGGEVTYRIRYRNAQAVPLAQASLRIRYPEGFVFEEASIDPINDGNDEWSFGTINANDGDFIDITGRLYGDIGEKQSIRAFLSYTPANFSSAFQKVESLTTEITSAPVSFTLEGPAEVSQGEEVTMTIVIEKIADEIPQTLALTLDPGDLFRVTESSPEADEDDAYRWSLSDLEEKKEIQVTGVFNPGPTDERASIMFALRGWKEDDRSDDGFILASETHDVTFSETDVAAQLVVNGSSGAFSAQPGEYINATLSLKNNTGAAIDDVRARLVFETPSHSELSMLRWAELNDPRDGEIDGEQLSADRRRGSISWDSTHIRDLGSIEPGDSVTIDVSLPVKTSDDTDMSAFPGHEIVIVADVQYGDEEQRQTLSSNRIDTTVNSDTTFDVRDAVEGNTHNITWVLSNSFHELEQIEVDVDLFGDIKWEEDLLSVPAGWARYDAEKKKLRWSIDQMPTALDVLALQFGVTLETVDPSQSHLTSKVRFKAKDVITGEDIILSGDQILLNGEVDEEE